MYKVQQETLVLVQQNKLALSRGIRRGFTENYLAKSHKMCKNFSQVNDREQEVKWKVRTEGGVNSMCKDTSAQGTSGKPNAFVKTQKIIWQDYNFIKNWPLDLKGNCFTHQFLGHDVTD